MKIKKKVLGVQNKSRYYMLKAEYYQTEMKQIYNWGLESFFKISRKFWLFKDLIYWSDLRMLGMGREWKKCMYMTCTTLISFSIWLEGIVFIWRTCHEINVGICKAEIELKRRNLKSWIDRCSFLLRPLSLQVSSEILR